MEVVEFEKHTFAYIALFIGAGMFVLWMPIWSIAVVVISIVANIILISLNSPLKLDEILINGGMLTGTVAIFTILLINTRYNLTKKEIIARLSLAESNKELERKNSIIAEQNKNVRDSITYAQRIQESILPQIENIDKVLPNYFIHYLPKDIVSGDFYWHAYVKTTPADGSQPEQIVVMAAVDCTGHGVPGALMSIIGGTLLNQTISNPKVNCPGDALNYLNSELNYHLKDIRDGMDIALVAINFSTMKMQYAGANNPVYIVRNNEIIELKPDKQPIGLDKYNNRDKVFTNQVIDLQKNDSIYLFTDGYCDQFGASDRIKGGKKFGYKQFQRLLLDINGKPMSEQKKLIHKAYLDWKGSLEQIDDICIIGIGI
jgi:serine phosphatase RsbU (regulator of sigma subunit)